VYKTALHMPVNTKPMSDNSTMDGQTQYPATSSSCTNEESEGEMIRRERKGEKVAIERETEVRRGARGVGPDEGIKCEKRRGVRR
jgi:hypothetical protein